MWTISIHGGAGSIPLTHDDKPDRAVMRIAMRRAVAVVKGEVPGVLRQTSPSAPTALAAAVEAVLVLEDSPLFNAGRGSCLNRAGKCELEAAVMVGTDLSNGAVCGLTRVKNPVLLADYIRTQTPHNFVGFDAAEKLALEGGFEMQDPEWFVVEKRRRQFEQAREKEEIARDHDIQTTYRDHDIETSLKDKVLSALPNRISRPMVSQPGDTVGAVVRDMDGNLAGAVSTGGKTNKYVGRIGDSPCIGCGLYVSPLAAVCGTGNGEDFVDGAICAQVCHAMKYGKMSLKQAMSCVTAELPDDCGGMIAVDADGEVVMDMNCSGMHRAFATSDGREAFKTFK